jgi:hypothetical protein
VVAGQEDVARRIPNNKKNDLKKTALRLRSLKKKKTFIWKNVPYYTL